MEWQRRWVRWKLFWTEVFNKIHLLQRSATINCSFTVPYSHSVTQLMFSKQIRIWFCFFFCHFKKNCDLKASNLCKTTSMEIYLKTTKSIYVTAKLISNWLGIWKDCFFFICIKGAKNVLREIEGEKERHNIRKS